MLLGLSIRNYALIDKLDISFPKGMISVTGETGAGKSIILGALKLVLGERADIKSISNQVEKSMIEVGFLLDKKKYTPFFEARELDFEEHTIIRREIFPTGKSRAFINDTPVRLELLQELTSDLIDIHSQYDTFKLLSDARNQINFVDDYVHLGDKVVNYQLVYHSYIESKSELEKHREMLSNISKDSDYNQFLLNELLEVDLENISLEEAENELSLMKNSEAIVKLLAEAQSILSNEEYGVLDQVYELKQRVDKASALSQSLELISERVESIRVEINDLSSDIESNIESLEFNEERYNELLTTVNSINSLFQKHQVGNIADLIAIRDELSQSTGSVEGIEANINKLIEAIKQLEAQLDALAEGLHQERLSGIPNLEKEILGVLDKLGMEKSEIKIVCEKLENFNQLGKSGINILFSANVGMGLASIEKSISGGERSRFMLAIKKIMAKNTNLPTLVLDEIDTGISGKVANEMGVVMREMAEDMQLIVITHLPQVAAKANSQFKVRKEVVSERTQTSMVELSEAQRVEEIAQLISGSTVTEAAKEQAKQLFYS